MSGIFGRFDFNGRLTDSLIDELGRWNRPYGDSGYFYWSDECFFAGCYYDEIGKRGREKADSIERSGKIGVFDSLIYNREELNDINFDNNFSDEDFIFSFVDAIGFDSLKRVNGDFAGAVLDKEKGELILFRDHMGVRPLYYIINNEYVAFSTEIRGICGMQDYEPLFSEEWLYNQIEGYPHFGLENTAFDNIKCVPPGGYLVIDLKSKEVQKNSYWQIGENRIHKKREIDYINGLRELVEDSVKRRLALVEDPVGAELSGGIDSGVIDILISRNGRKGVFYSWSYSPERLPYQEWDERLVIKDICDQENIECNYATPIDEKTSRTVKFLKELGALDEGCPLFALKYAYPPFANTAPIMEGSEFLSKLGAKVIFTGHGGDEGVSHRAQPYEMLHFHEYYHYLRYMFSKTHGKKMRVFKTLKEIYVNIKEYREDKHEQFTSVWASPQIMTRQFAEKGKTFQGGNVSFGYNPIEHIKSGGSRSRLDNVAMQGGFAGVHYMVPYLDHRVVDYAVSIPRYMYLRGRRNRYIFREAFKDIMPESLYMLKGKRTASFDGIDDSKRWFKAFSEEREYVYSRLDRSMWKDYLDFNYLDEWMKTGEPSDEERMKYKAVYANMFNILMIQNMLEKSKKRRDT